MSRLLSKLAERVLKKVIAQYVEEVSVESVGGGRRECWAKCSSARLRPSALMFLADVLPLRVTTGFVRSLSVTVTYSPLSAVVRLDGVVALASPPPEDGHPAAAEWEADLAARRAAARDAALATLESDHVAQLRGGGYDAGVDAGVDASTDTDDETSHSWIENKVRHILANLHVDISDINVRYESHKGGPALGIVADTLALKSTDAAWAELGPGATPRSATDSTMFKLASLTGLGFYIEPQCDSAVDVSSSVDELAQTLTSLASSQEHCEADSVPDKFVLHGLSAQVRISLSGDTAVVNASLDASPESPCVARLSQAQFAAIVTILAAAASPPSPRPPRLVDGGGAAAWWAYLAGKLGASSSTLRLGESLVARSARKHAYIRCYFTIIVAEADLSLTFDDCGSSALSLSQARTQLAQLEADLSIEDIQYFRELALDHGFARLFAAPTPDSAKKRGVKKRLMRLVRRKKSNASPDAGLGQTERDALAAARRLELAQRVAVVYGGQSSLSELSMTYELIVAFPALRIELVPSSETTPCFMANMRGLVFRLTPGTASVAVAHVDAIASRLYSGTLVECTGESAGSPALEASIDFALERGESKPGSLPPIVLRLTTQPAMLTYHPGAARELASFFAHPLRREARHRLVHASARKRAQLVQASRASVEYILTERRLVEFDVSMAAPVVTVLVDPERDASRGFVATLGSLTISSEQASLAYQRYQIELAGARVVHIMPAQCTDSVVIDDTSLSATVQRCVVSDDLVLLPLHVEAEVQRVAVALDELALATLAQTAVALADLGGRYEPASSIAGQFATAPPEPTALSAAHCDALAQVETLRTVQAQLVVHHGEVTVADARGDPVVVVRAQQTCTSVLFRACDVHLRSTVASMHMTDGQAVMLTAVVPEPHPSASMSQSFVSLESLLDELEVLATSLLVSQFDSDFGLRIEAHLKAWLEHLDVPTAKLEALRARITATPAFSPHLNALIVAGHASPAICELGEAVLSRVAFASARAELKWSSLRPGPATKLWLSALDHLPHLKTATRPSVVLVWIDAYELESELIWSSLTRIAELSGAARRAYHDRRRVVNTGESFDIGERVADDSPACGMSTPTTSISSAVTSWMDRHRTERLELVQVELRLRALSLAVVTPPSLSVASFVSAVEPDGLAGRVFLDANLRGLEMRLSQTRRGVSLGGSLHTLRLVDALLTPPVPLVVMTKARATGADGAGSSSVEAYATVAYDATDEVPTSTITAGCIAPSRVVLAPEALVHLGAMGEELHKLSRAWTGAATSEEAGVQSSAEIEQVPEPAAQVGKVIFSLRIQSPIVIVPPPSLAGGPLLALNMDVFQAEGSAYGAMNDLVFSTDAAQVVFVANGDWIGLTNWSWALDHQLALPSYLHVLPCAQAQAKIQTRAGSEPRLEVGVTQGGREIVSMHLCPELLSFVTDLRRRLECVPELGVARGRQAGDSEMRVPGESERMQFAELARWLFSRRSISCSTHRPVDAPEVLALVVATANVEVRVEAASNTHRWSNIGPYFVLRRRRIEIDCGELQVDNYFASNHHKPVIQSHHSLPVQAVISSFSLEPTQATRLVMRMSAQREPSPTWQERFRLLQDIRSGVVFGEATVALQGRFMLHYRKSAVDDLRRFINSSLLPAMQMPSATWRGDRMYGLARGVQPLLYFHTLRSSELDATLNLEAVRMVVNANVRDFQLSVPPLAETELVVCAGNVGRLFLNHYFSSDTGSGVWAQATRLAQAGWSRVKGYVPLLDPQIPTVPTAVLARVPRGASHSPFVTMEIRDGDGRLYRDDDEAGNEVSDGGLARGDARFVDITPWAEVVELPGAEAEAKAFAAVLYPDLDRAWHGRAEPCTFIIDLGMQVVVAQVDIRNARGVTGAERGARRVKIALAVDPEGPWLQAVDDELRYPGSEATDALPLHSFRVLVNPSGGARFVRVAIETWYEIGPGLTLLRFQCERHAVPHAALYGTRSRRARRAGGMHVIYALDEPWGNQGELIIDLGAQYEVTGVAASNVVVVSSDCADDVESLVYEPRGVAVFELACAAAGGSGFVPSVYGRLRAPPDLDSAECCLPGESRLTPPFFRVAPLLGGTVRARFVRFRVLEAWGEGPSLEYLQIYGRLAQEVAGPSGVGSGDSDPHIAGIVNMRALEMALEREQGEGSGGDAWSGPWRGAVGASGRMFRLVPLDDGAVVCSISVQQAWTASHDDDAGGAGIRGIVVWNGERRLIDPELARESAGRWVTLPTPLVAIEEGGLSFELNSFHGTGGAFDAIAVRGTGDSELVEALMAGKVRAALPLTLEPVGEAGALAVTAPPYDRAALVSGIEIRGPPGVVSVQGYFARRGQWVDLCVVTLLGLEVWVCVDVARPVATQWIRVVTSSAAESEPWPADRLVVLGAPRSRARSRSRPLSRRQGGV
ncbi:uncharacterized protein AMSG_00744 [Thecamonas trahens ATCC 50062]|uniref:F5/8 type C domain-containing protein n=1 Tax=Thecamonas trahens ATCC 50062 TaxID=461836 RepID=A0A0L0DE73_THETB|nr:hypothetical protein AMSG_00744 [Thecamonas trahens ATCC 50062]KNC50584.1 hypothetical protein AMSG_00744 [Thecamonas trahens ATCC 50062]|eukprot:XP_013762473.1 hypothetical protein AMSG_00744 [Thecamonas trahens ATCC 50062]